MGYIRRRIHVWAKIGNKNYDPTRRALDGTWSPPPRGPGGRGGGNTYVFNGPVYGGRVLNEMLHGLMIKL